MTLGASRPMVHGPASALASGCSLRAAAAASSLFAYEEALAMLDRAYECADALDSPLDCLRIEEKKDGQSYAGPADRAAFDRK